MSEIAVGDTVRRVKPCEISACEDSWHRLGWEGVVASRSERALYFGAGAQGGTSNYERVTHSTVQERAFCHAKHICHHWWEDECSDACDRGEHNHPINACPQPTDPSSGVSDSG